MTVTIYRELEQGSEEWLQARCGLLTASTIGRLITPTLKVADNEGSRGLLETLVAERLTGHVDFIYPTADMQRGTLDEPLARDLYAEHYAPVEQIGFAVREFDGHKLGASPDGLVGEDGGIEIKSRRPKQQLRTILSDTVPAENMAQIQALMLVLQRDWWEYVSYAGGWPLYVKRVYPEARWQDALQEALADFEYRAEDMIESFHFAAEGKPVAPRVDHFAETEIRIG